MTTATMLGHIDAKREIAAADTIVRAKELRDKAEAIRHLGVVSRDPELVNRATEFKLRAERRLESARLRRATLTKSQTRPPKPATPGPAPGSATNRP